MTKRHILGSAAAVLVLISCSNSATTPHTNIEEPRTSPLFGASGIAIDHMDLSVRPGDNFFEYVSGTWMKNLVIPAEKSRYGAMTTLIDQSNLRVKNIIESAAAKADPSADEKRIGDYYNAYMNMDRIEEVGLTPLKPVIGRIADAMTTEGIVALMIDPSLGLDGPVSPFVYIDFKQNDQYAVYLSQSGLGLPNRDYYIDTDSKSVVIRAAYIDYLVKTLTEAGVIAPRASADAVMAFETALAKGHWSRVQRRDREKMYNKMTRTELNAYAPGMPWDFMFETLSLGGEQSIILREKDAIHSAAAIIAQTDISTLRDYLHVKLISNNSDYLPKRINEAHFEFYEKMLRGSQEQRPRWKRAVGEVNGTLGEIVGKVYVAEYFPESSKAKMNVLVENIRAAFRDGITELEWMGDATKAQAQYKLAKFNSKIGYPDRWETYDGLNINSNDLIETVQSARAWDWADKASKLGQPIDRGKWSMPPQRVNAYYSSVLNEIVFPAAILDAPYFDPQADPAVNYGGIGGIIGHEMGHGFDDQGRKSDGDGLQRDWWTKADAAAYESRVKALAEQYSLFEPLPGEPLDGRLGLGENIGDLTGVTMAYKAYKRSLNGEDAPIIDGLTGDQRFFMAWAQVWAIKWREQALRGQIKNGPHSPGEFRVNGVVRNFGPWYDAFDVGPDNVMYLAPEDRVVIW